MSLNRVNQFRQKAVQGLYTFNHFERADGAWFQQRVNDPSNLVLCLSPSMPFEYYNSVEQIEARLAEYDSTGA